VEVKVSGAVCVNAALRRRAVARRTAAVAVLRCDRDPLQQRGDQGGNWSEYRMEGSHLMSARSWLRYSSRRALTVYAVSAATRIAKAVTAGTACTFAT